MMMIKGKEKGEGKNQLKHKRKRKGYQQFIDEITKTLEKRREIEELFKRVIILDAETVLKELEIKERNMEALKKLHEKQ